MIRCALIGYGASGSHHARVIAANPPIPKPVDPDDPCWQGRRIRPQWLAFADLVQAYRLALTAPGIGFEIVTVVGENSRRRRDLRKAKRVLGYCLTIRLEECSFELGDDREPFEDTYP